MADPKLEEVFKISGVPTYTFVKPKEYTDLLVSLRTPGRGVVVEGPSGIGKTSAVENALRELHLEARVTKLSARKPDDVEYIRLIPGLSEAGVVIIDDFHKLPDDLRSAIADYLKTLADEERKDVKLVILGINKAGENLITFAHDLVNRLNIIRFESNPDSKIEELVAKGEAALRIDLNVAAEVVEAAQGSFYLAQMLCHAVCVDAGVLEASERLTTLEVSFEAVRAKVWDRLALVFRGRCETFCRGNKPRKEGRAPYLQILNWLATSNEWTLSLRSAIRNHPNLRGSVGQVVEKGYLKSLIDNNEDLKAVLHFDDWSDQLTVEDPQFLFFTRNIPWRQFAAELGFFAVDFERRYDFALSFAGADRDVAESLFVQLSEREIEVFYDRNEQHRILAEDVEEYLRPIYQSEAEFIIVLLGREYPERVWAKFESDAFKERFKDASVIPVWFSDAPPGMFDASRAKGGFALDRGKPLAEQVANLVAMAVRKLLERRPQSQTVSVSKVAGGAVEGTL